jgi:hypothetical protein
MSHPRVKLGKAISVEYEQSIGDSLAASGCGCGCGSFLALILFFFYGLFGLGFLIIPVWLFWVTITWFFPNQLRRFRDKLISRDKYAVMLQRVELRLNSSQPLTVTCPVCKTCISVDPHVYYGSRKLTCGSCGKETRRVLFGKSWRDDV